MPDEQLPLPPTTTEQQNITHAGQRKVNLIWEYTQALIAIFVVFSTMGTAMYMEITGRMDQIPTIFSTAFGMIVGVLFCQDESR